MKLRLLAVALLGLNAFLATTLVQGCKAGPHRGGPTISPTTPTVRPVVSRTKHQWRTTCRDGSHTDATGSAATRICARRARR